MGFVVDATRRVGGVSGKWGDVTIFNRKVGRMSGEWVDVTREVGGFLRITGCYQESRGIPTDNWMLLERSRHPYG